MTAPWDGQSLRELISAEQPCGQNLDDTSVLSAFDALRLFGQLRSPEAPPDADDGEKALAKARPPLEWDRIRADALEALARSKDLRLLGVPRGGAAADRRPAGLLADAHVRLAAGSRRTGPRSIRSSTRTRSSGATR